MPVLELLDVEDVIGEVDELSHLVLNAVEDTVDGLSTAGNLLEIRSQDLLEFLKHFAGFEDVTEDSDHVLRLGEDVLGVRELPAVHGVGELNLSLSLVILFFPAAEDDNGLVDLLGGVRLEEDFLDVDLITDFLADLVRDGFQDEFKFVFVLVNMSGDSPDEFQTVQKRRKSLLDHL